MQNFSKPTLLDAIIWDWNGTIMDDVEISVDAINTVLRRRNMKTIVVHEYREIFRFPVSEYYKDLGFTFEHESFEVVGKEFIVEYENRWHTSPLQKGIHNVLQSFRAAQLKQYVLSAASLDMLSRLVAHYQIGAFFQDIAGLNDIYAAGKIDLGKQLIARTKMDPQRTLLIGDTSHDAEVAKALGVKAIMVAQGHESATRLQKTGFPVARNSTELMQMLKQAVSPRRAIWMAR